MTWLKSHKRLIALVLVAALTLTGIWNGNLFPAEKAYADGSDTAQTYENIAVGNTAGKFTQEVTATVTIDGSGCSVEYEKNGIVSGYEIAGWFIDPGMQTELKADNMSDSVKTLYPKWKLSSDLYKVENAVRSNDGSSVYYYKEIASLKLQADAPATGTKENVSLSSGENKFSLVDGSGIESDEITLMLTEDTNAPQIQDAVMIKKEAETYDSSYTNDELTAVFSITDSGAGIADDGVSVVLNGESCDVLDNQDGTYSVAVPEYTGDQEGEISYTYTVTAKDRLGNQSLPVQKEVTVNRDKKAPVISVAPEEADNYGKSLDITVSAEDSGSGLRESDPMEYSLYTVDENGTMQEVAEKINQSVSGSSGTISLTADAGETVIYSVSISAWDKTGNKSIKTVQVKIDEKGPDMTVETADAFNKEEYYNASNSKLTVTAVDKESGVVSGGITVSADGQNISGTEPELIENGLKQEFNLNPSQSGETKITVKAQDQLGNQTTTTKTMKIDIDAPVINSITAYNDSEALNDNDKCDLTTAINKEKYFVVDAADSVSGIAKIKYSFENKESNEEIEALQDVDYNEEKAVYGISVDTTAIKLDENNEAVLYFWAIDNAGNISSVFSQKIKVDNVPPVFTVLAYTDSGSGTADTYLNNLIIGIPQAEEGAFYYLTKSDSGYNFNEADKITLIDGKYKVQNPEEGEQTYYIWAEDALGNRTSQAQSITVKIDLTRPELEDCTVTKVKDSEILISENNTYYVNNNFSVCIKAADNYSGIDTSGIEYYTDSDVQNKIKMDVTQPSDNNYEGSIDISGLSAGSHTCHISVKDKAGNVSDEKNINIYIDRNMPDITDVSSVVNGVTADNEAWINDDITYTVSPSDSENLIYKVYYKEAGTEDVKEITSGENGAYKLTIPVTGMISGETYSYAFWAVDKAGNKSSEVTRSFRYDNVSPEVKINIKVGESLKTGNEQVLNNQEGFQFDFTRLIINSLPVFQLTFTDSDSGISSFMMYECDSDTAENLNSAEALSQVQWGENLIKAGDSEKSITAGWSDSVKKAVFFKITDQAGNVTYATSGGIVFDTQGPEINFKDYSEKDTWVQKDGNLEVQLEDFSGVDTGTIRYAYILDNSIPSYEEAVIYSGQAVETGSGYSISVPLECKDTAYELIVYAKDKAGNLGKNSTSDYKIKRDEEAPAVSEKYIYDKFDQWNNAEDKADYIGINVSDNASGIKQIQYQYSFDNENWKEYPLDSVITEEKTVEIPLAEYKEAYQVTLRLVDHAGNSTEKFIGTVQVDNTCAAADNFQYNYNDSWINSDKLGEKIFFDVEDIYSGLQKIEYAYSYTDGSDIVSSGFYVIAEAAEDGKLENKTYEINPPFCDYAYTITVRVTDIAGNVQEYQAVHEDGRSILFKNEKDVPELGFRYDSPDKWTNADNKLSLILSDKASGIETVEYHFSFEEDGKWTDAGFAKTEGVVENGNYDIALPFEDSPYTVSVKVTDRAGNSEIYETDFEVKKDHTSAGIKSIRLEEVDLSPSVLELVPISFGEKINKVSEPLLTADIEDNASGIVRVEICRVDNDAAEELQEKASAEEVISYLEQSAVWNSEFEQEKSKKEVNINYTVIEDNKPRKYILYIKITDEAGNITYGSSNGFIYDQTKADVKYEYSSWNTWTNQDLSMTVNISDNLSGIQAVEYAFYYENQKLETINDWTEVAVSKDASGNIWTMDEAAKLIMKGSLTLNLPYDKNPYYVAFKVTDNAGNQVIVSTDNTVNKDNTAPEISDFTYKYKNTWTAEDEKLVVKITDEGSKISKERIQYSYSYEADKWYEYTGAIAVNGEITIDLPYHDSPYSVTVRATDMSGEIYKGTEADNIGNWSEKKTEFTVNKDKTLPSASIAVGDMGTWENFVEVITFGLFKNTEKEVKIETKDNTMHSDKGGIKCIEYYIMDELLTKEECMKLDNGVWTKQKSEKDEEDTVTFSIKPTRACIVYVRVTDAAGNVFYLNSGGIVLDNEAPVITFDYADRDIWSNNGKLTIGVAVSDAFAGLASVKTYRDYEGETTELTEYSYDKFSSVMTENENKEYTIEAKDLPEGDYKIRVVATDKAGNTGSESITVKKDLQKAKGKITIKKDKVWSSFLNVITFGLFYKDSADVEITAEDIPAENVNETSRVKSTEYYKTKESLSVSDCESLSENSWKEYKEPFSVDPDEAFIIYARITDYAGNITYLSSDGIVLDQTEPGINMEYVSADKEKMSGVWTNQQLDIGVTVSDLLSGIREYHVYKIEGTEKTELENHKYENNNDKKEENQSKTFTIQADELADGNYIICVEAYDKTGNFYTDEVNVKKDTLLPVTKLTYEKDGIWTNEELAITGDSEETGDDSVERSKIKSVKYYIDSKTATKTFEYTEENSVSKYCFEIAAFDLKDGDYEVKAVVEDWAGNTVEDIVRVRKDRVNPTGTIQASAEGTYSFDTKTWQTGSNYRDNFKEKVAYGLFADHKVTVTLSAEDVAENITTSGIDYIEYFRTAEDLTEAQCSNTEIVPESKWKKVNGVAGKAGDTFTVDKTEQFITYLRITDQAGNVSYLKSEGIVVDNEDPVIVFEYAEEGRWTNKNLTIDIKVSDAFSGLSAIKTYRDYNGTTTELTEYDYHTFPSVKTENESKAYTIAVKDLPEGNYTIRVVATDKAGNEYQKSVNVKKDKTAPTGQITIGDFGTWKNFLNVITFGLFSNTSVPVNISSGDTPASGINETSGIASVEYLRTSEVYTSAEQCEKAQGWTRISGSAAGFNAAPEQNMIIYTRIRDYAGNETYICSNGVVLDSTKSSGDLTKPAATITAKPVTNDIYSDSIAVSFLVVDPVTAGSVTSGLKTVTYKIVNRDTGYETAPVTANVLENVLGKYGQRTGSATKAILAEASTYGGTINVPKENFNSNNVEVVLDAVDNAGNVMDTKILPLKIDVTVPVVNLSYDNNNVGGYDKYFSSARTLRIAVTERNFDASAVNLIITKNGAESVINGTSLSWNYTGNTSVSNKDADIYAASYTFADDADYTVRMECADLAGNICTTFNYEGAAVQDFTIDNIDPVVQTTASSGYTSEAMSVTATIREHNFNAADVSILVTRKLNGAVVYSARSMNAAWSDNGDAHTAVLTFAEDGDYTFTITYKDKAGRNAAAYSSPEFTVDNTNPVLLTNVSAQNHNIANKGDIHFEYTYYDINSSLENGMISYKLTTLSGKVVNWEPSIEQTSVEGVNGYKLIFHDLAETAVLADGIYILNVSVKDKAGRSESNTVTFSVNRKGSAYDYEADSYLATVVSAAYVKEIDEDIQIVVVNCDEVTGYEVVIYNSLNEQIVLTEGEDYTWTLASTDEEGWKKYICTIHKSVFAENGTYSVVVLTKDNADDSMYGEYATLISNKDAVEEYRKEISFTVDNISPEVVLSGVKNGENYDTDTDIKIDYSDANNIEAVIVERLTDDGEIIDTVAYTEAEIAAAGEKSGRLIFTATEYDSFQSVQVTVTDCAGNAETASVRILITSNAWIKFINNTPAVIAVIACSLLAASVIIIIFVKRRKKDSSRNAEA